MKTMHQRRKNSKHSICDAEKGNQKFLVMMQNPENRKAFYTSLHWKEILTAIIKSDIPMQPCTQCAYQNTCCHSETMMATAKPGKHDIRILEKEKYVSLEEAESNLALHFQQAIMMLDQDIHIIKAQTGLGKTNAYITYMKQHTGKPLLIAVPTHHLKEEIYAKAKEEKYPASLYHAHFVMNSVSYVDGKMYSGKYAETYQFLEHIKQVTRDDSWIVKYGKLERRHLNAYGEID